MGKLIEQQSVIDCLTNTAKYYERKDADEWTKGIHYGLLHGVDNILDNVLPVEAIPKADYETRLKADLVAMLKDLSMKIGEIEDGYIEFDEENKRGLTMIPLESVERLIDGEINSLKEDTNQ